MSVSNATTTGSDIVKTLRGVDQSDSLTFNGMQVSFAGGADMMIADKGGMYESPEGNHVQFVTDSLGFPVTLEGTAQTRKSSRDKSDSVKFSNFLFS